MNGWLLVATAVVCSAAGWTIGFLMGIGEGWSEARAHLRLYGRLPLDSHDYQPPHPRGSERLSRQQHPAGKNQGRRRTDRGLSTLDAALLGILAALLVLYLTYLF